MIESAHKVLDGFKDTSQEVEAFKVTRLSRVEQLAFGEAALIERFREGTAPVTPAKIIEARRLEDEGDSLWLTFQRVQENAMRGEQVGFRGEGAERRRVTTRAIEGIDGSVKVNRALWQLTERMRQIKDAGAVT